MHFFLSANMALTATLITFSTNSNFCEYTTVVISNVTIGSVIIPNREADNTVEIRYYGFKMCKSCYYRHDK